MRQAYRVPPVYRVPGPGGCRHATAPWCEVKGVGVKAGRMEPSQVTRRVRMAGRRVHELSAQVRAQMAASRRRRHRVDPDPRPGTGPGTRLAGTRPRWDLVSPDEAAPRAGSPRSERPVTAVLLDLDGTVTDSAPVILESCRHVLASFGLPVGDTRELMRFVGPPLTEGFRLYAGLEGEDNAEAVRRYREHYRSRMCEAPVYEGMEEALASLGALGLPLALATSKREDLAEQILAHDGLAPAFAVIAGADPQDRYGSKEEVVRVALSRLAAQGADLSRVVHVGDRAHDVNGAHAAGVECIGVLWGYGDRDELAGADWLVSSPEELVRLLARLLSAPGDGAGSGAAGADAVPGAAGAGAAVPGAAGAGAAGPGGAGVGQTYADDQQARDKGASQWPDPVDLTERTTATDAVLASVGQPQAPEAGWARPRPGGDAGGGSGGGRGVLAQMPPWLVRGGLGAWLALGIVIVVCLGVVALAQIVPVFVGVFIALVVTALLRPVVDTLAHVLPRYPATFLALLGALGVVVGLVAYVVTSVTSQWATLAEQFSTGVDTILDFIEHGPLPVHLTQQEATEAMSELADQGRQYVETNATSLAGQVLSNAGTVVNVFIVLALALFCAIFFLGSGQRMWQWFLDQLPARLRKGTHRAAAAGWYTFAGYARGTVILALTDAVMAGIFLQVVGIPLAAPLAVLVFIGAFIPMIGAPTAMIVAMVVALASKGVLAMVLVCLGVAGIGQIEGHVLQPLIMGRQVSLHPVVVLLAVAVGSFSAGLLGAVVAVPLVSVAWSVYSELHTRPQPAPVEAARP